MNLRRSLSSHQLMLLEGVVRQYFAYYHIDGVIQSRICLSGYSDEMHPIVNPTTRKAFLSLIQRGYLVARKTDGRLIVGGDAVAEFGQVPEDKPEKKTPKMSRTRAARNQSTS